MPSLEKTEVYTIPVIFTEGEFTSQGFTVYFSQSEMDSAKNFIAKISVKGVMKWVLKRVTGLPGWIARFFAPTPVY